MSLNELAIIVKNMYMKKVAGTGNAVPRNVDATQVESLEDFFSFLPNI
jgi:hypothetical protein